MRREVGADVGLLVGTPFDGVCVLGSKDGSGDGQAVGGGVGTAVGLGVGAFESTSPITSTAIVGSFRARKSAKILSARFGAVGYGSVTSGSFSKTRISTRVAVLLRSAPIRLERSAGACDTCLRRLRSCTPARAMFAASTSHCCFQKS